jgi:anti-sigma regulatory factor (Ser/Thr protein kinase)
MCARGVLWQFDSTDALAALHQKRAFLQALHAHAGWPVDDYAALVVFTELVGNVARHAPGPVRVVLECNGKMIAIRVQDRGAGFDFVPSLPADALNERGRGLFLVAHYATSVRLERSGRTGTSVIATLRPKVAVVPGKKRPLSPA